VSKRSREPGVPRQEVSTVRKAILTYGPALVGPALWAYAKFPERLRWTSDAFARLFGVLAAFYEDWTKSPGYGEALEMALTSISQKPGKVIDLATGTGYVARRIKQLFPEAEVTGVDIAPEMVAIAEHEAKREGLDIQFEVGDISGLPFEDNSVDVVILQNAMPYPEEMMRVAKPGGQAILVFSYAGPWVAWAWPAVANRFKEAGGVGLSGKQAGMGFYGVARKGKRGSR
jgi:SAM-dependent methyltransferase